MLAELGVRPSADAVRYRRPVRPGQTAGEGNNGFERAAGARHDRRARRPSSCTAALACDAGAQAGDRRIDVTSPFGVRVDPFLHVPAMHTGIDFRGEIGEPIHATAAGA